MQIRLLWERLKILGAGHVQLLISGKSQIENRSTITKKYVVRIQKSWQFQIGTNLQFLEHLELFNSDKFTSMFLDSEWFQMAILKNQIPATVLPFI